MNRRKSWYKRPSSQFLLLIIVLLAAYNFSLHHQNNLLENKLSQSIPVIPPDNLTKNEPYDLVRYDTIEFIRGDLTNRCYLLTIRGHFNGYNGFAHIIQPVQLVDFSESSTIPKGKLMTYDMAGEGTVTTGIFINPKVRRKATEPYRVVQAALPVNNK